MIITVRPGPSWRCSPDPGRHPTTPPGRRAQNADNNHYPHSVV